MIHVSIFGENIGESILIELPDNKFGVIDCYNSIPNNPGNNRLLEYLKDKGIDKLLFVLWSHPHEDHSSGLHQLFEYYGKNIQHIWRFHTKESVLKDIIFFSENKFDSEDTSYREVNYYLEIFRSIQNNAYNKHSKTAKISTGKKDLLNNEEIMAFTGVSPHPVFIKKYEGIFESLNEQENPIYFSRFSKHHNKISASIEINYGECSILFGSDTETDQWEVIYNDRERNHYRHPMHFIKVCHHGSENAIYPPFWEEWSRGIKPCIAITRFGSRLPRPEGLRLLSGYTDRIFITSEEKENSFYKSRDFVARRRIEDIGGCPVYGPSRIDFEISNNGQVKEAK